METVTSAFTQVFSLLTATFNFITGNAWFLILLVAPLVFGIVAALLSIFHRGG